MTKRFLSGMAKSLKPLFNNGFTKEFTSSFRNPDVNLEFQLTEICLSCPLQYADASDNGLGLDLITVDECRMKYFGQLLQSFVGRPGEDETLKLYSYLKKCEGCLASKLKNAHKVMESNPLIKN